MIDRKKEKAEAIKLRNKGLSYNEIRKIVPVSKSSLSLWLKSIRLKSKHRKRLYTKQIEILARGPRSQKERREKEIKEIINKAEAEITLPLSPEVMRLMGAALYWAEGTKRGMCEVTNSDPHLILFMVKWFEKIFEITPLQLKARLNIYPQQSDIKIKKFWSELTGIPLSNFGKSFIKPLSKNYKKNTLYYGTIKIEVPKSVNIKHRIFGWISGTLKNVVPSVELVQAKWDFLKVRRPNAVNLH